MKVAAHKKQVALFLTAVLLPIIVLVALTMRMIKQERELTQKRVADEHRAMVRDIGGDLAGRLEVLVRREASAIAEEPGRIGRREYPDPEVVLLADVTDTRLVLPWEINLKGEEPVAARDAAEFGRILLQAENAEFSQKNYSLAVERYRRAAAAADSPARAGYARLQRARCLLKIENESESLLEYQDVLSLGPGVIDEYGIPIALYAMDPLLGAGSYHTLVTERIRTQLESGIWLSPAGVYLMKDILERVMIEAPGTPGESIRSGAEEQLRSVLSLIQIMEQALRLKDDYPRLGLEPFPGPSGSVDEPLWITYGQKAWLVGLSPPIPEEGPLLVAVDFEMFSSAYLSDVRSSPDHPQDFILVTGISPEGATLGPDFPGLSVVFGRGAEEEYSKQWSLQRLFYFIALVVVLIVTLFGAYLLWRDVRREVQMAELRSQFVSSVSHELKTPLTAIRMFAETLRLGRSRDPGAQVEYLDTIVNESERLTRLLNNVLDFSKIEQGKRIYQPTPAHLDEIVKAAARAMEYPLKQQGFELDLRIDEDLPPVHVDRDSIEQAVLNLLSNAMKYSGGSRWIGLNVLREGDCAVIQVVDKGVGIDPKEQTRIFDKFYRVPTPENQSLPGTGLGLALVDHIAKAHGGSVRVESTPDEGSMFSILLPLESEL